jgi:hypothetical protein
MASTKPRTTAAKSTRQRDNAPNKAIRTTSYFAGQEQPTAVPGDPTVFRVFDSYVSYTATPQLSFALDVNHTTNQVTRQDPTLSLTGPPTRASWARPPVTALRAAGR